jgi:hypothetical protein
MCGTRNPFEVQAGALGGPMATPFNYSPPPAQDFFYGNLAYPPAGTSLALGTSACGEAAMIIGVEVGLKNRYPSVLDPNDGLFTASSKQCHK